MQKNIFVTSHVMLRNKTSHISIKIYFCVCFLFDAPYVYSVTASRELPRTAVVNWVCLAT